VGVRRSGVPAGWIGFVADCQQNHRPARRSHCRRIHLSHRHPREFRFTGIGAFDVLPSVKLSASMFALSVFSFSAAAQSVASGPPPDASSADNTAELAKKLQNPISSLISVPFQSNFDFGGGPAGHGSQYLLNIQPVIPFKDHAGLEPYRPHHHPGYSGKLRIAAECWWHGRHRAELLPVPSPVAGLIVGAGPVFLYPTATDDRISANQFAAGPTGVLLKQCGPWTFGVLANQLWGFGGIGHNGFGGDTVLDEEGFTTTTEKGRSNRVNSTNVQPFGSYTFPTKTTISFSADGTYDWTGHNLSVPVVGGISQLLKIGPQIIRA
jgi:hypothetical protein